VEYLDGSVTIAQIVDLEISHRGYALFFEVIDSCLGKDTRTLIDCFLRVAEYSLISLKQFCLGVNRVLRRALIV